MKKLILLIILFVIAAGSAGGAWYYFIGAKQTVIKRACLEQSLDPVVRRVYGDVEGLCACTSKIDVRRPQEERKAAGQKCLDLYSRENMIERCGNMVAHIRDTENKILNCECFYTEYTREMSDIAMTMLADGNIPREQGLVIVDRAIASCSK
ncbi:MAG: hypothetical protein NDJ24_07130 [Alphaproteobacteria bacterium]|nr:hypothetical protein [Alphaproteobacteria bacterium]